MPATLTSAVLVYDGECEFCTACVRFLVRRTRRPLRCVAYQEADLSSLGLARVQCEESVQWVSMSGEVASAHIAVACALRYARWPWPLAGRIIVMPGIRRIAATVYRRVAARRTCAAPTPPVG
ncbi:MAG: thiol-disulfide oxidoreductase DCC family protein [Ilumatobacteraceae bacterium]